MVHQIFDGLWKHNVNTCWHCVVFFLPCLNVIHFQRTLHKCCWRISAILKNYLKLQRPLVLPIYATKKQNKTHQQFCSATRQNGEEVVYVEMETTLQLDVCRHTLCVLYYAALQHQLIFQSAFLPRECKGTWP